MFHPANMSNFCLCIAAVIRLSFLKSAAKIYNFHEPTMAFCHYFSDVSVLNVHLIMDIDVKFVYCKFEIILHWTIIFYFNNLQIGCFGHLLAVASRKGLQEKPFHFRFTLAKICQDRMARRQ